MSHNLRVNVQSFVFKLNFKTYHTVRLANVFIYINLAAEYTDIPTAVHVLEICADHIR